MRIHYLVSAPDGSIVRAGISSDQHQLLAQMPERGGSVVLVDEKTYRSVCEDAATFRGTRITNGALTVEKCLATVRQGAIHSIRLKAQSEILRASDMDELASIMAHRIAAEKKIAEAQTEEAIKQVKLEAPSRKDRGA